MRTRNILLTSLTSLVGAGLAGSAAAQVDVEPPMPNVMIMLDTSGSMSRRMGGDEVTDCSSNLVTDPVRWFELVTALTGNIDTLGCNRIERTGTSFTSVFGADVPDLDYYMPYLQITSGGCALIPNASYLGWGASPAERWFDYPFDPTNPFAATNAIVPSGSCTSFDQQPDGVIDKYKRTVRFGLMTFDPLVADDVGITNKSGNDADVDVATGKAGTWSYWYTDSGNPWYSGASSNWFTDDSGPSPYDGNPPACSTAQPMEVGARNPAAPPWEGRMMGFGYETASSDEVAVENTKIEQMIAAIRPYGATPLAGMLSDFRDMTVNETHYLPGQSGQPDRPLGPRDDGLWLMGSGCRPFHVLLITDGEPNLDLRPDCAVDTPAPAGVCPFDPIVSPSFFDEGTRGGEVGIVNYLHDEYGIIFHVVGVAVGEFQSPAAPGGPPETCADPEYYPVGGSRCASSVTDRSSEERTCCILNAIEYAGNGSDSTHRTARYATDAQGVKDALDDILVDIASGTATRTTTTYASVGPRFYKGDSSAVSTDIIVGHEVRAALETTVGDGMWGGQIARSRILCEDPGTGLVPVYKAPDASKGDSFETNLKVDVGTSRFMYTVVADGAQSWRTLRPHLDAADPDDMGVIDVDTVAKIANDFVEDTTVAGAMGTVASKCTTDFGPSPSLSCEENILRWYVGLPADTSLPDNLEKTRSNPLGAIYHSQPVIVGPPREFVRDEAYDEFALQYQSRPTVLYAASVDGQLHAFKMADNDTVNTDNTTREDVTGTPKGDIEVDRATENNELWSFIPPIALGRLQSGYNRHSLLLDGGITVANLPAERAPDAAAGDYLSGGTALSAVRTGGRYRTFLVGSSGRAAQVAGGGYYYALDVSDPRPDTEDFDGTALNIPSNPRYGAPHFLWQMSRTDAGDGTTPINDASVVLFGDTVPAAAVTTINYKGSEVAVAILAGGISGSPSSPSATRLASYSSATANGHPVSAAAVDPRDTVRDWGAAPRPDRSITVVRVDTGEILLRYVGLPIEKTSGASTTIEPTRVRVGEFYSPMSGTPVAYPGLPGQVSTRVFIGDADGILWSLDMSDPDPMDASGGWKLQIAWDPYNPTSSTMDMGNASLVPRIGPVETVPIVSVDNNSNPIILFATGSQESFYSTTGQNFVVSVRGTPSANFGTSTFETEYEALWQLDLSNAGAFSGVAGQRVTGALNLFNGVTYFATFVPSGNSCTLGSSRIWALDYDATSPTPVLNLDAVAGNDAFFAQSGTVFGVAIGQLPSCQSGSDSTPEDEIFGGYSSFTSATSNTYQLIVQTGRPAPMLDNDGSGTEGTIGSNANTIVRLTKDLTSPPPKVRVDSWAAIVE